MTPLLDPPMDDPAQAAPDAMAEPDGRDLRARLARLISGPVDALRTRPERAEIAETWSASLRFVRQVAERMRDAQQRFDQLVTAAREGESSAILAMRRAEARAVAAEMAVLTAEARADKAEAQLMELRQEMQAAEPATGGVDHWLREAHRQLLLVREGRAGPATP